MRNSIAISTHNTFALLTVDSSCHWPLLPCLRVLAILLVSAFSKVSAAYLTLVRLGLRIINVSRSSSSLRITSLYRLNKSGEKAHSCLPAFLIFDVLAQFLFYLYVSGLYPVNVADYLNAFPKRHFKYTDLIHIRLWLYNSRTC